MHRPWPRRLTASAVAAGALLLAVGAPAWAQPTTAQLSQSQLPANNPLSGRATGQCAEVPNQATFEDVWVFAWPGNSAGVVLDLALNFDSNADGVADAVRDLTGATQATRQGVLTLWLTTPAGWTLVSGTSTVSGTIPGMPTFSLDHSCAGGVAASATPSPTARTQPTPPVAQAKPISSTAPKDAVPVNQAPTPAAPSLDPAAAEQPDESSLPVTGPVVGGMVVAGAGLLAGGIVVLAMRRKRGESYLGGS